MIRAITTISAAITLAITMGATTAASASTSPARFTGQDLGASSYQVPTGGAAYATSFQIKYWRYDTQWLASGDTALSVSGQYATVSPGAMYLEQRSNGAPVTETATVNIAVPAGATPGTITDTVTATESNSQPVVFHFSIVVPKPDLDLRTNCQDPSLGASPGVTGCSITQTGGTGVMTVTYTDPVGGPEIAPGTSRSLFYGWLRMTGRNAVGYVTFTSAPVITASSPPPAPGQFGDGVFAQLFAPPADTLVTNNGTEVWGPVWDGAPWYHNITIPLQYFTMELTFTVSATP